MPEVPLYTAAQVQAAEAPLLAAGEPLMLRASAALARIVREEAPGEDPRVLVLAGGGNNGGDALFAGAELAVTGVAVDVALVGRTAHDAGRAAAVAAGARIIDAEIVAGEQYDVVMDGVLGIGTQGAPALRGRAREAVAALLPAVRAGRTRVVAVDLPSGLHPDEGTTVDDVVLPADVTVTFGGVKAGLVCGAGPSVAGRVVLVDIGLGPGLSREAVQGTASVSRVVAG
jgi:hydroxyethylthiazole kinase-like uncharacterized protein yjeF